MITIAKRKSLSVVVLDYARTFEYEVVSSTIIILLILLQNFTCGNDI